MIFGLMMLVVGYLAGHVRRLAVWDLTELERAVLAGRFAG